MIGSPRTAVPPTTRAELAELRTLLGVTFDRSRVAALATDRGQVIVAANRRAEMLLTGSRSSLLGRSATEFRVGDVAPAIDQQAADFRSGAIDQVDRELELRTESGHRLTVALSADMVTISNGQRFALIQFEEKGGSEPELTTGELRYRLLAANLPESSVIMFDRDLRVTLALGEGLIKNGYEPALLTGNRLEDVLPAKGFAILEPYYRDAIAGVCADFDYLSPSSGLQFRVRALPVTDPDGRIVGGMALSGDISADRTRQSQIEQFHRLSPVGICTFTVGSGWYFDQDLLALWGMASATDVGQRLRRLVLPDDLMALEAAAQRLQLVGGRSSLAYRIRHGRTGQVRWLRCTFESVVDDGTLLSATATHMDVTDPQITFSGDAGISAQAANDQRAMLLRQITDAIATARSGPEDALHSIANLASADLDAAAVLRVLTEDLQQVEVDVTSHPDPRTRAAISTAMTMSTQCFEPGPIRDDVIRQARIVSSVGPLNKLANHTRFAQQTGWRIEHSITAPIRHQGKVLGLFSVIRSDPNHPYAIGDENLVQVLADFAGGAIAEHRVRASMEREASRRLEELTVQQRELLEELAGMELRERSRIADSIHEEPIQLIVAAAMRIDLLRMGMGDADEVELDRLAVLLEESVDWLRTLTQIDLAPPDLSQGLLDALRKLGRIIFGSGGRLQITGPATVPLSPPATTAAYRIVREALLNAKAHARAEHVEVFIEENDTRVAFTITDDGIGGTGMPGPGHLGLATMKMRAEAEGGQLHIRSKPGGGTTVVLILPAG